MNPQIPRPISIAVLGIIALLALWLLGGVTPRSGSPGVPPAVGQAAAPIVGKTADGKEFRLSDLKGKVVLVNFWATWCGPCRMEIPELVRYQKEFAEKGFTVVGISLDDSLEAAGAFAKEQGINYPVLLATRELQEAYGGVSSIPATFLIDRRGNIVFDLPGYSPESGLEEEIKKALGV